MVLAEGAAAQFHGPERQGFGLLELVQLPIVAARIDHQAAGGGVFLAQHATGSIEGIHEQWLRLRRLHMITCSPG